MRAFCTALLVLGAAAVATAQPQGTCANPGCATLEKWDCSGGTYPTCNADSVNSLTFYSRSNLGAVGPNGETVVRTTHTGQTDTGPTGEYYVNRWVWSSGSVTQGACRYHRLIWRPVATIDWSDNDGGRFGVKYISQGTPGATDGNRYIFNFRSDLWPDADTHEPTHVLLRAEQNVSGDPTRVDIHQIGTTPTWQYIQAEICSSTTTSSANATHKIWQNTNTYASPTQTAIGGFNWDTTGWELVELDLYAESVGPTHSAIYDIAAYEYDDQFDTNWYRTGGAPAAGVYRIRFKVEWLTLPFGALGSVWFLTRQRGHA